MEIMGYIAAVLIGISLGLIGGGGSILTVPVLVYLFSINPVLSTSYSLFVVGSTSLIGAYTNYRRKLVSLKTASLFGISSILTVFITRKWVMPFIPEHIFDVRGYAVTKSMVTMVLFAILMVLASISMIKTDRRSVTIPTNVRDVKLEKLLLYGVIVGLVTGLLGAGGGFLLIPGLVLLVRMPMKKAVGTSLVIIALNSLIGFLGDMGHFAIDWVFLIKISLIAIAGIFIGGLIGKHVEAEKLKKGFGWFVLIVGLYIIGKELLFQHH
jgi:hypothetical protein